MEQNTKPLEQHQSKKYGEWLLSELENQGVTLSVASGNGLHIKGEITPAQKENIRLWKRWLIEALSPHCSNCTLPLQLINDGTLWFCPFGCESRNAE